MQPLPIKSVKKIVFIFSLKEAFFRLHGLVSDFDDSHDFSYAILSLLTASVMEQESFRGTYDDSFKDAVDILKSISMKEADAFSICTIVAQEIIDALTEMVPDFGTDIYNGKYEYHLRNRNDVQLTIDQSVYT